MSRVPTYGGSQVRMNPLPGVREVGRQAAEDPASLGAGVGATIAQGGLVMNRELIAHQQDEALRQDQARVVAAENGVSQWELKNIYDPKDGALAQTGVKAFGLPDTIQKQWDEQVGPIRESLSNDRQKEAFDRAIASRKESIFRTVNAHVLGQMRAVEKDGNDSYIANSYQLAVANAGNPERIAAEIDNSRVHAGLFAQSSGMDSESTKRYVESVTSNIHVGVIDRLLATKQPGRAQDYFDAAKDEISRLDISKVEHALEIGVGEGQAQAYAQKIAGGWVSAPDATTMVGGVVTVSAGREKSLQEALDEADKIDANDPAKTPLADEVRRRIRLSYSDFKATQNEAQQQAAAQTKQILDDAVLQEKERKASQASLIANGIIANHVTDVRVFDYIDRIAPGQRALMSPEDLKMWKSYAKQMSEKGSVDTDLNEYYRLLQEGVNDPEKFKAEKLNQYHAVIGQSDLQSLMQSQAGMIRGEQKPPEQFVGYRSTEQIVESAMAARGMVAQPTVDSTAWKEKVRAMSILDRQVTDLQASLPAGTKVSNEDKQLMMDNLIIDKKIPGWFYGYNVETGFAPTPATLPRGMTISDVPQEEQRKIRAAIRAKGFEASDAAVVSVYVDTHGGAKK